MILFLRHYDLVFIQFLVLFTSFPLLFGQYIRQDTSDIYDDSRIKDEEIIRRQKLVQPHLLQIAKEQKNWIETYHMNFDAHETIPRKKGASSSNDLVKERIQNEMPSLDLNMDTLSDYSGKSEVPETLSLDPEVRRLRIVKDYTPKLKNLEMGNEDQMDFTVMSDVTSSTSVGPKSVDLSDDIKRHSEEDVSIDKFIVLSEQELTEIRKYKSESGHSTSYSNKQNKDFELLENIKLKESKRRNHVFNVEQHKKTGKYSVLSELKLNHNNIYHCSVGSMKDNFLHIIKELTDMKVIEQSIYDVLPLNGISDSKNHEVDYPLFKTEETKPVKVDKNNYLELTEKSNTIHKGHHIRQNYVKSYMSSLDKGKEYWRETYDFSFIKIDQEESFKFLSDIKDSNYLSGNPNEVNKYIADVKPVGIQEKLYFHRWLKKILNKLIGHPYTEHVNIVFTLSPNALNELQKLSTSEKYESTYVDELISDLISKATISYDYNINSFYASISSVHIYIFVCILLFVILIFAFMHHPYFRTLLILIFCILCHGYKMYAEKVAEKHAVLSASSSEYCESILNKESGIFAHVKEFFRYSFYDDHCKKYFEALMIDPVSELSISIVVSDFVSSAFFQLFRPMSHALNVFVKNVFRDLSILQVFYVFCILILISIFLLSLFLIYNRYKLHFPMFMGSIEPTIPLTGSRVEDIPLEPKEKRSLSKAENELISITKETSMKICVTGNNGNLLINNTEPYNFSLKALQDNLLIKRHQLLKRRSSC